jgi:hypothetical protein
VPVPMPALPLATGDPLSDVRERIERIELGDLLAGEDRARARWLDRLYRNFLYLCAAQPGEVLAPPAPIDAVWRAHASDPDRYRADCQGALGRVPPFTSLAGARERYHRRHREELGVEPLVPDRPRELIDSGELRAMDERARRPAVGLELPWDPARQRMRVSGDVAHWSGDLQARIRRDGLALVEWEGPGPRAHQAIEQLSWAFGRPVTGEPLGAPLVVALLAEGAAGEVVLVRASGVWRSLRHRFSADVLEEAAAPDSLVVEVDRRHVAAALLPRLSRTRRGLWFSTACTRVFPAPGVGALFRAIGEVVSDPDLQLRLRVLPGQVLVLDHLSWRIGRAAGLLHRVDFASPALAALALGFKAV